MTKLKEYFPKVSIEELCALFGKTRHAWYDKTWRAEDQFLKDEIIIQLVLKIREELPRVGTRKLLHMLKPQMLEHKLDAGRDYLFDLLGHHKLLIKTRRRKAFTTDSKHWMHKYPNLIKHMQITRPDQLWVSDITFIRMSSGFSYLSLITDAYSHKVVGYNLSKDPATSGCIKALEMAIANRRSGDVLIHHSDRGCQYCCKDYVGLLNVNDIRISMTHNGDPYENAVAERLNGILKCEFNFYSSHVGFEDTVVNLESAIGKYNNLRPHLSCDYLTPLKAHQGTGPLKKHWKNYYKRPITNP